MAPSPDPACATALDDVTQALRSREPIFHRPEHGSRREDFDAMMAPGFFEVGASGRVYPREFVLDELDRRRAHPLSEHLVVDEFACRQLAADLYLVTYHLDQDGRKSRRATLWRMADGRWQIVYHQGTLITA